MSGIISRPDEERAVDDFLGLASKSPAALLVEGAAGIGKTTLCLHALDAARGRSMQVLTTRPAQAESVVAYSALADLLGGTEARLLEHLPQPQMKAVDQVLLRADETDGVTEPRAVAAAFLALVEALAAETPVLVAIDDVQWLDPSSLFAVSFAARRFIGRVGVLATRRTEPGTRAATELLQVRDPTAMRQIALSPFSIGELSDLLTGRLGRHFTRSEVRRIHEISGGNPFYALELGRVFHGATSSGEVSLPDSLSDVVEARIHGLNPDTRHILLAAACLSAPSTEVIAKAMGTSTERVAKLLEPAEADGIVRLNGGSLTFSHPLLAHGVYAGFAPSERRAMHRAIADVVEQPELRARHLARGATSADATTLAALDEAAQMARNRGAPSAAAELLDLAIALGGDDPDRQIRSATHHFESGAAEAARSLLNVAIKRLKPGRTRAAAASLLATIVMYADGFGSAASLLEGFLPEAADDAGLSVQMLMALAYVLINIGRKRDSANRIDEAVQRAEALGQPTLLSRALGLQVVLRFMCGAGVDEAKLQRALALEDDKSPAQVAFQPRVQNAILRAWIGELAVARRELRSIHQQRIENGEESESIFISYHRAMVEIWSGEFDEARRIADDAMDRAAHLDGDVHLFSAIAIRSSLAAFAGEVEAARSDARVALDASDRSEGRELGGWMVANLGFLETSLGRYAEAVAVMQPVIDGLLADPDYSEIIVASCVGDAVESMVQLERLGEAQRLTDLMGRNGTRLDRAWMLAVAGRCSGMLLAARGDLAGGIRAAEAAMTQHDRVPMPFERARTQLLLGQLQRRLRKKHAASASLREALDTFERLGTPLWADRARADLARVTVNAGVAVLTPSERQVAELVASGMTNRAIAAELFISPKTVDTNLFRIYRKLSIHSRAELARWVSEQLG
ncbi:LuxR family transcriptional regulator [Mycobacterium sp. 3519A]|uniref:helix-turn-helix transcriptional regulator n=1 Tax=Mycobacterium sp. 3519A TaxID=2057184 RepID=UPI001F26CCB7|nr:LuxR family transcriptional regulator [Mycobacterium sp. 3519A]